MQIKELHINGGYSLESADETGQTVLHYASALGHFDMVKFVLGVTPVSLLNRKDAK